MVYVLYWRTYQTCRYARATVPKRHPKSALFANHGKSPKAPTEIWSLHAQAEMGPKVKAGYGLPGTRCH